MIFVLSNAMEGIYTAFLKWRVAPWTPHPWVISISFEEGHKLSLLRFSSWTPWGVWEVFWTPDSRGQHMTKQWTRSSHHVCRFHMSRQMLTPSKGLKPSSTHSKLSLPFLFISVPALSLTDIQPFPGYFKNIITICIRYHLQSIWLHHPVTSQPFHWKSEYK